MRTRLPRIVGLAAGAVAVATPFAGVVHAAEYRSALRYEAVRVVVPGAQASSTGSSAGGAYAYRDLVSVGSYSVTTGQTKSAASARVDLSGVSLLGGLVTVGSIESQASADGTAATPTGAFAGAVSGLTVGGAAVAAGPNARFSLPDGLGYGVVEEQSVLTAPGAGTYRGASLGVRLHLDVGWHGLPAGTEVELGYADAGAEGAPPPPPTPTQTTPPASTPPTSTAQKPAQGQPSSGAAPAAPTAAQAAQQQAQQRQQAQQTAQAALPPTEQPIPGAIPAGMIPTPGPGGPGGDPENAPPGGFSVNPPVDPLVRARLLGGSYVFPVAGGASFSNDFGAPRADTGFHQGIDLFAPLGTPVVAVHDGTLLSVGWNRLGGHRLWLKDTDGNLFYYAHLSAYAPRAQDGAQVHAGDILGFVGNTGDAQGTPYHLHFEMHPGGQWAIPPYAYVSTWLGRSVPVSSPLVGGTLANGHAATATAPAQSAPANAGPLVALGSSDISSASGLDPNAVVRAARQADLTLGEGDGALLGGAPSPTGRQTLSQTAPLVAGSPSKPH